MSPAPAPTALTRWPTGLLLATMTLVLSCGCASRANVEFIDLNFKRIEATGPLINRITAPQCRWWIDGDHLIVTCHHDTGRLAGALARERFDLSFVLKGLPAERARDYRLDTQSLRAVYGKGTAHRRFASLRGIVAVWLEANDTLRGRFRLVAKKQIFHVLTGWADVGQVVMVGDFHCRRDRAGGEPVLERTEAAGMDRRAASADSSSRPRPVQVEGPPVKNEDEQSNRGGQPR